MYITSLIIAVVYLFMNGLGLAIISFADVATDVFPLFSMSPFFKASTLVFAIFAIAGHFMYRQSGGKNWIKFEYVFSDFILSR